MATMTPQERKEFFDYVEMFYKKRLFNAYRQAEDIFRAQGKKTLSYSTVENYRKAQERKLLKDNRLLKAFLDVYLIRDDNAVQKLYKEVFAVPPDDATATEISDTSDQSDEPDTQKQ